jgi:putative DNA primase/helicase
MNAVFLTNDLHALQISPGDRRYMVIRTPGGLPREYYAEVVAELDAGGAAALYQHLLDLPLGDFDEHTKPPLTAAKEDLIEQSYNSAQFFQVQLKAARSATCRTCRA